MNNKLDYFLGRFLVGLMAIMTLDVLWGVFTRYALGSQASWTEELARFTLIWIGVLGAAYASGQKMHLSIDLLSLKLSTLSQLWQERLIRILIILFAIGILIIGGGRLIYISHVLGQTSPALQVPMAIVYGVLPISGLLIVWYKTNEIIRLSKKTNPWK